MDKVVVLCLYLTILNNIFGIRLSCKKKRWIAVVLLTLVGTVFVYGAQYYLNVDDIYGVTILAFAAPFFLVEERGKVKMTNPEIPKNHKQLFYSERKRSLLDVIK